MGLNNQLQSVDTNGDNQPDQTFAYTALKQRVKVGGSILAYNGQQVVTQHNGGSTAANPTASWVYASYIDEPIFMLDSASGTPTEHYYHRNRQYSVSALTSSTSSIIENVTPTHQPARQQPSTHPSTKPPQPQPTATPTPPENTHQP